MVKGTEMSSYAIEPASAEEIAASATPAPAASAPKKGSRSRAKKATAAKGATAPNPAYGLLNAMKFIGVAQSKNGTVNETFCHIGGRWAAASNGVLTVATKIEEDLTACPRSTLFVDALGEVSGDLTITQISAGLLSVASGDFRAVIPCAPAEQVPISPPDEPVAVIDDRIKLAFEAVLKIPNETSPRPEYAGVLLQGGSVVATNGAVIFEYWHGIDLPPNLLLPKVAIQAVARAGKPLVRLGFSSSSVTFWFEDQSFIKTQTFAATFPPYQHVINCDYGAMWPIPENFFQAVEVVANFSENGSVFFKNGQVVSDPNAETPSYYRIDGLPEGVGFNGKYIAMIQGRATRIMFGQSSHIAALFFVGDNLRGCIAALENRPAAVYNPDESGGRSSHGADFNDDEIPF